MPDVAVAILVTILGLAFGSFANVVIWRFPRGESLSHPPSRCPNCDTPITWRDNIPILSWLLLRGRCRSCGVAISRRYPIVEAASGGLWLTAWLVFGTTWQLPFAISMYYLLLILSAIDLDTFRLPNGLVGLLAAIGLGGLILGVVLGEPVTPLIGQFAVAGSPIASAAVGVLAGSGLAWAIAAAYSAARGAQGLGMGDVKLLAALGPFLGPYTLLVLFIGSVIGSVGALVFARSGEGKALARRIPFGPSLALAAVVVSIFGEAMWGWYASFLG